MDQADIIAGAERAARLGMRLTPTPSDARPQTSPPPPADGEVNPVSQPPDPGVWVFRSATSEEAARRFAYTEGFGTLEVAYPSAEQIWKLRQMYKWAMPSGRNAVGLDLTADIELTWIPQVRPKLVLKLSNKNAAAPVIDLGYGIDEHTGLAHEPKNGLECRQDTKTGCTKHYQTMRIDGKKITLDRGPCKTGYKEDHRLWHYDGAKWIRWCKWQHMDWNDKDWIGRLNKYRDQCANRLGWHRKRPHQPRFVYSQEQLEWVFDLVVKAGGALPGKDPDSIAQEFNERFELNGEMVRREGVMRSLLDRLVREYVENDGQMAKRQALEDREERKEVAGVLIGMMNADDQEGEKVQSSRSAAEEDAVAALLGLGKAKR
ncbi:hypothetical protein Slin14017_G117370 [Septoria linicola]|nr:hypothetical protein Slin14017_G117370 [Septoria linicola]